MNMRKKTIWLLCLTLLMESLVMPASAYADEFENDVIFQEAEPMIEPEPNDLQDDLTDIIVDYSDPIEEEIWSDPSAIPDVFIPENDLVDDILWEDITEDVRETEEKEELLSEEADELFSDDLVSEKSKASISTQKITLYTLESAAAEYIQVPSNYRTSYKIKTSGTQPATFKVISGDSVTVDANGNVIPTCWYHYGFMDYPEPIDGMEPDRIIYRLGESTIQVKTGSSTYNIVVNVVSYETVYTNQKIDEWIQKNITPTMTDYEKIEEACKMAASYDYSPYHSSAEDMVIFGGGSCWSSTYLIIRFCERLGFEGWARNGDLDYGTTGTSHMNAVVKANGKYYEAEAGYVMKAPRYYNLRERSVPFSWRDDYETGGMELYQYDGNGEKVVIVPDQINGKPVTSIGAGCFSRGYSEEIEEIILPETIKTLDRNAFGDCSSLSRIVIPASVENIGEGIFSGCISLEQVQVASGNPYYCGEGGMLFNKNKTILLSAPAVAALNVPAGVTEIARNALNGNTNLKSIRLNGVTTLREGAFARCENITQIDLGSALKVMEDNIFYNMLMYSVTMIQIPNSVTSISDKAFYGSSIEKIMSDRSVYIKQYCDAHGLTYVEKNHKHQYVTSITKKPTYKEAGIERHTCKICDDFYTTEIPKKEPIKVKVSIRANDVLLSWEKKSTDSGWYNIYRKEGNGAWKELDCIHSTSESIFKSEFKPGVSYYFSVTDYSENDYDEAGIRVLVTESPKIAELSSTGKNVSVKWNAVTGAEKYRLYKKSKDGKWVKICDTKNLSYVDNDVAAGESYTYAVRTISADGKAFTSGTDYVAKSIPVLERVKVSKLVNTANGMKVTWTPVKKAAGYYVYRKTGSDSYSRIATIKGGTTVTYEDKTSLKNGVSYGYAVKAYNGKSSSTYIGLSAIRLARPAISSCVNGSSRALTVKWNRNTKATGYQVQYVLGSAKKTVTVKNNTTVSYVIKSLIKGNKYKVYVRSYRTSGGKNYYSAWSAAKSVMITK